MWNTFRVYINIYKNKIESLTSTISITIIQIGILNKATFSIDMPWWRHFTIESKLHNSAIGELITKIRVKCGRSLKSYSISFFQKWSEICKEKPFFRKYDRFLLLFQAQNIVQKSSLKLVECGMVEVLKETNEMGYGILEVKPNWVYCIHRSFSGWNKYSMVKKNSFLLPT